MKKDTFFNSVIDDENIQELFSIAKNKYEDLRGKLITNIYD